MNPVDALGTTQLTRRAFMAGSLGTLAAALVAAKLRPLTDAYAEEGTAAALPVDPFTRDGVIDTLCEMCVWRCGVTAKVGTAASSSWTATRTTRTPAACSARAARPGSV